MTSCVVIGAGPVGTSMALALAREGFDVTLFEREARLPADPRAATLQPPTLEMLTDLGTGAEIIDMGLEASVFQFRDRASDEILAEYDYGRLEGLTRFPFAVQCEQFKVADANARALEKLRSGSLHLATEVTEIRDIGDRVVISARSADGTIQALEADYVIGCDGGKSGTRKSLGIAFEGFTYEERFLVLTTPHDFFERGFRVRNYVLDPTQWCALFKVPHEGPPGLWRTVFPAPAANSGVDPTSDDYTLAQIQGLDSGLSLEDVTHRNIYTVNQRVAASFWKGRVFLAGDAAHVNNPLGGLGMNSGIHDAINLVEKLVAARNRPDDAEMLFDAYDRERRGIAERYVQAQTIQNKKRLEARTPQARAAAMNELRESCSDPDRHLAWVVNASLIAGLNSLENDRGEKGDDQGPR